MKQMLQKIWGDNIKGFLHPVFRTLPPGFCFFPVLLECSLSAGSKGQQHPCKSRWALLWYVFLTIENSWSILLMCFCPNEWNSLQNIIIKKVLFMQPWINVQIIDDCLS